MLRKDSLDRVADIFRISEIEVGVVCELDGYEVRRILTENLFPSVGGRRLLAESDQASIKKQKEWNLWRR